MVTVIGVVILAAAICLAVANALEVGEPHLDPLAFAARPLVGLGADPRPSHVAGTFINAARNPAKRRLRTASRFPLDSFATDTRDAVKEAMEDIRPGAKMPKWPLENIWVATSAEDQVRADERIPLIAQVSAAVRWCACSTARLPELPVP